MVGRKGGEGGKGEGGGRDRRKRWGEEGTAGERWRRAEKRGVRVVIWRGS